MIIRISVLFLVLLAAGIPVFAEGMRAQNWNSGKADWGNQNTERRISAVSRQNKRNGGQYMLDELPMQEIDSSELAGLLLMREEEKLARDVYQYLGETWNMPIFFNISSSEQTHTDAVKALLERYAIEDPMMNDTPGQFADPELQALYDSLTQQGSKSLQAALETGAAVEDLDIKDLNDLLAGTDNEDLSLVYENLRRGSENHIRSFTRQLESLGVSYEAQYISAEELAAILQ